MGTIYSEMSFYIKRRHQHEGQKRRPSDSHNSKISMPLTRWPADPPPYTAEEKKWQRPPGRILAPSSTIARWSWPPRRTATATASFNEASFLSIRQQAHAWSSISRARARQKKEKALNSCGQIRGIKRAKKQKGKGCGCHGSGRKKRAK